ncbi:hypothetical protein AHiyo8_46290 [Arthrobacter sp. Hiyo8]|nr:hypothetical protein AHiyo8_46290 [Arthrobacter sp. Hiyo8]
MLVIADKLVSTLVGLLVRQNENQVNQGPNPDATQRDKLQDAGTDLTQVEPVYTEPAQEERQ